MMYYQPHSQYHFIDSTMATNPNDNQIRSCKQPSKGLYRIYRRLISEIFTEYPNRQSILSMA